ncbi:histidinol-phosphate transaminase [Streptomyces sp. MJP52]|uniref:histidinol-phosphate transaminase n=1 Tax=Streptomyces sp. MJP52 TaxID=2940555 RepID=UPI0024747CFB|nr:histidinol-phosphate transaminase [Streptomyces sp. MJP52]MDH6227438.1 histidinol-phosphate aminotransferase [Streptomyces sp. MJP52]
MSEIRIDDLPVREELRGKSPYGAPQLDVPVRLNTNENPYPLPDALVERIAERVREAARHLNRYPDRDAVELRTRLAGYLNDTALPDAAGHRIGAANVWAANGSNEVLQQLLQTFGGPGRTAIGFEPSYSMHALIARGTGTGWISGPRHDDFTIDVEAAEKAVAEHRPDVVFVTTPNNPTGNAVPAEAVLALYDAAQAAKPSIVVVDEAYVEFSHGASLLPLLEGRPHLVISRTMSKAFGAAGLRLGYFAAHPAVVDAVQLVRLPYHLSAVTQATALAALEHTDTLLGYVEQLKKERDRLVAELRGLGYEVTDSDANFVQFGRFEDAHATWRRILDHGVLVRDNGVPGRLRVTAGTPAENDAFLEAVRALAKDAAPAENDVKKNEEHNA